MRFFVEGNTSVKMLQVSAPQWLWSGFYLGSADLHTPGQKWVWNSPVQIGLEVNEVIYNLSAPIWLIITNIL